MGYCTSVFHYAAGGALPGPPGPLYLPRAWAPFDGGREAASRPRLAGRPGPGYHVPMCTPRRGAPSSVAMSGRGLPVADPRGARCRDPLRLAGLTEDFGR